METNQWLPLTEYATKRGISISTLRRKIKTNAIGYRMEEGRYLVLDKNPNNDPSGLVSSDAAQPQVRQQDYSSEVTPASVAARGPDTDMHFKALDARVAGLARKVDLLSEQLSELKMLVQIFEERLEKNSGEIR